MEAETNRKRKRGSCCETLLASSLQILVENGFLRGKDLEVLALTSKAIRREATNVNLWKCVCHRDFPCSKTLSPDVLSRTGGYHWWYSKWSANANDEPEEPFRVTLPPSCTADDINLFVHVYSDSSKSKVLASFNIQRKGLRLLVETGGVTQELSKDVVLHEDIWIQVDMFRATDKAMCRLCDGPINGTRGFDEEDGYFLETVLPGNPFSFRRSTLATQIQIALKNDCIFCVQPFVVHNFDGDEEANWIQNEIEICFFRKEGEDFHAGGEAYFKSLKQDYGITLLHLLSELKPNLP